MWSHQEKSGKEIKREIHFDIDTKDRIVAQLYFDATSDTTAITDSIVMDYKGMHLLRKRAWRKLPEGYTLTTSRYIKGKLSSITDYKHKRHFKPEFLKADSFIYGNTGMLSVIRQKRVFKGSITTSYARQEFTATDKKLRVVQTDGKGTVIGITRWHYDKNDSLLAYTVVSGSGFKVQLHDSTSYLRYPDGTLKGVERKRNGRLKYLYNYDRERQSEEAIHFASNGKWTRRTVYNLDTLKRTLTQTYTSVSGKPGEPQQMLVIKQQFNENMQLLSQETKLNDQMVKSFLMKYNKVGLQVSEVELTNRGATRLEKRISYQYW